MADHVEIVAAVKDELLARGVDLAGPCGAFQITSRVAWRVRDEGWGLIAKNPGQNGCTVDSGRYAVDALMMKADGAVVDLLINSETENRPGWQLVGPSDPGLWRAPFNPDHETDDDEDEDEDDHRVPGPVAACGCAERLDAMAAKLDAMTVKFEELTRSVEALAARPAPPAPDYRGSIAGVQVVLHPSQ